MRIGEAADRLGVNPKTIRYYESVGLIPQPPRTAGGYRDYEETDVDRIRFVKTARRLDLTLDEIGEVLAFADRRQAPCGHVRAVVGRKVGELDDRISEMTRLRDELLEILRTAPVAIGGERVICPLIEHDR